MKKPKLLGRPCVLGKQLTIKENGSRFVVGDSHADSRELLRPLKLMNGQRTVNEISVAAKMDRRRVSALVRSLDHVGLTTDDTSPNARPALEVLFELEDLANDWLYQSIYRNIFWKNLLADPARVPLNVLYGMAIENYHFLFRESYFDAPALNYPSSTKARVLMNEFYAEEYGHDELILKGLNAVDITREDLADTVPLPTTMGLCNSLAFWARYDPVFFFSTLGVLEGKDLQVDSYVTACERRGLSENFIKPIRSHAEINMNAEHGNLTRAMFAHLPALSASTVLRMKAQTRLFVRLYDGFYTGIWNFYATSKSLLRRVSELGEVSR